MFGAHLATDLKSIEARQHHIKNHHIIGITQGKIKTGVPIMREIDGMTLFQQDPTQQIRQALFVLYHKDMHCSIPLFSWVPSSRWSASLPLFYAMKIGNRLEICFCYRFDSRSHPSHAS